MSREFYKTKAWKDVRKNIWLKQYCLCARCGLPVYVDGISNYLPKEKRRTGIVHHKTYLTNENVNDMAIALGEDNLEGLCIDCHNKEHINKSRAIRSGLAFDDEGNVVEQPQTPPNQV